VDGVRAGEIGGVFLGTKGNNRGLEGEEVSLFVNEENLTGG
jgi:hypothetical protein